MSASSNKVNSEAMKGASSCTCMITFVLSFTLAKNCKANKDVDRCIPVYVLVPFFEIVCQCEIECNIIMKVYQLAPVLPVPHVTCFYYRIFISVFVLHCFKNKSTHVVMSVFIGWHSLFSAYAKFMAVLEDSLH